MTGGMEDRGYDERRQDSDSGYVRGAESLCWVMVQVARVVSSIEQMATRKTRNENSDLGALTSAAHLLRGSSRARRSAGAEGVSAHRLSVCEARIRARGRSDSWPAHADAVGARSGPTRAREGPVARRLQALAVLREAACCRSRRARHR